MYDGPQSSHSHPSLFYVSHSTPPVSLDTLHTPHLISRTLPLSLDIHTSHEEVTHTGASPVTVKGRAHARRQTVEYGVFVHPLVLSSGARHGPRIARPHGVNVLKLELSASTTIQARAATGAEELVTQEELPAEPDSGSEGSSTPLCPPWRPAGARPRSSLSPR